MLLNELMNKACQYSSILTQFHDCYIQVKDNEMVDRGSLKGDRYMQVNLKVNIRDHLWEVAQ